MPNIANPNSYSKSQAIVLTVEKSAQRIVNAILMDSKINAFDLYQINVNLIDIFINNKFIIINRM